MPPRTASEVHSATGSVRLATEGSPWRALSAVSPEFSPVTPDLPALGHGRGRAQTGLRESVFSGRESRHRDTFSGVNVEGGLHTHLGPSPKMNTCKMLSVGFFFFRFPVFQVFRHEASSVPPVFGNSPRLGAFCPLPTMLSCVPTPAEGPDT